MKILILTFLIALEAVSVLAQHVHEPMRLTLPLMQEFVHISWERPRNIKRTEYGVSLMCKNIDGKDTTIHLTQKEYERYISVVKKRMVVGYTDSVSIKALHDFVVWNNPLMYVEEENIILIFPHLNDLSIRTKVPKNEYLEYLDMKIKELEKQRMLLRE
jgi:hypothetical protein